MLPMAVGLLELSTLNQWWQQILQRKCLFQCWLHLFRQREKIHRGKKKEKKKKKKKRKQSEKQIDISNTFAMSNEAEITA